MALVAVSLVAVSLVAIKRKENAMKKTTVNEIKQRCILAIMRQRKEETRIYDLYTDARRSHDKVWIEHCHRRMDEAHAGTRALVAAFETMFEEEVPATDEALYNMYIAACERTED